MTFWKRCIDWIRGKISPVPAMPSSVPREQEIVEKPKEYLRNISREDLINEFFRVQKQLGRSPTYREMQHTNKNIYVKYSVKPYERTWGNWTNFLEVVGASHAERKQKRRDK